MECSPFWHLSHSVLPCLKIALNLKTYLYKQFCNWFQLFLNIARMILIYTCILNGWLLSTKVRRQSISWSTLGFFSVLLHYITTQKQFIHFAICYESTCLNTHVNDWPWPRWDGVVLTMLPSQSSVYVRLMSSAAVLVVTDTSDTAHREANKTNVVINKI